jgi:hypothetical protein
MVSEWPQLLNEVTERTVSLLRQMTASLLNDDQVAYSQSSGEVAEALNDLQEAVVNFGALPPEGLSDIATQFGYAAEEPEYEELPPGQRVALITRTDVIVSDPEALIETARRAREQNGENSCIETEIIHVIDALDELVKLEWQPLLCGYDARRGLRLAGSMVVSSPVEKALQEYDFAEPNSPCEGIDFSTE